MGWNLIWMVECGTWLQPPQFFFFGFSLFFCSSKNDIILATSLGWARKLIFEKLKEISRILYCSSWCYYFTSCDDLITVSKHAQCKWAHEGRLRCAKFSARRGSKTNVEGLCRSRGLKIHTRHSFVLVGFAIFFFAWPPYLWFLDINPSATPRAYRKSFSIFQVVVNSLLIIKTASIFARFSKGGECLIQKKSKSLILIREKSCLSKLIPVLGNLWQEFL